ncbi:metal-dependent hydrolase [Flammeovirga sp. MY04]|uniref:metal-dependent hydrolase n=1 Tax=Flammeovirga sp. MY04 TaxID=1191459 RepID=UPI0008061B90|nr:metal-dependent hydrolase [Flammeovirga sp. MY04]ANQ51262.1 metal-dependent hydrolase [Flammeovirga sp. MY04]
MDSLTQIVLGAAVGEAVLGKKIGNKAPIYGAIAGTIPDLDVLANPFLDAVQQLHFHRSISHSLIIQLLISPLFGYLFYKMNGKNKDTFKDWTLLVFLGFTTHSLLDTCTTWGTQLFWPFSHYGFATYSVFVVDPHYTLPFMVCLIWAMFLPKDNYKRTLLNYIGIIVSTSYLLLGFIFQQHARTVFTEALTEQGIPFSEDRMIVKTTPLNIFLWSASIDSQDKYYTGFYSIFDRDKNVNFQSLEKHHELLQEVEQTEKLKDLLYITKGYYTIEKVDDHTYNINDLRFGSFDGWKGKGEGKIVFVYEMKLENDPNNPSKKLQVFTQKSYKKVQGLDYFKQYFKRVYGNKTHITTPSNAKES